MRLGLRTDLRFTGRDSHPSLYGAPVRGRRGSLALEGRAQSERERLAIGIVCRHRGGLDHVSLVVGGLLNRERYPALVTGGDHLVETRRGAAARGLDVL